MTEVSIEMKKKFVSNNGLPITMFEEPYFTDRLAILERINGAYTLWKLFLYELNEFNSEEEYFELCRAVVDSAVEYIKSKSAYEEFLHADIQDLFPVKNYGINKTNVYKRNYVGDKFLSIDLSSANFTALRKFNPSMVENKTRYEDFIRMFTDISSLTNSKKVRQKIFGSLTKGKSPLETIEMHLIQQFIPLTLQYFLLDDIKCINKDEIVIRINEHDDYFIDSFVSAVRELSEVIDVPVDTRKFTLKEIVRVVKGKDEATGFFLKDYGYRMVDFKCIPANYIPMIAKYFYDCEPTENDKSYMQDGKILTFSEIFKIKDTQFKIK